MPRQEAALDSDWRFCLGETTGAEELAFDDSQWRQVELPHDFSVEGLYRPDNPSGGACAYLPGGVGWYRRTFLLAESDVATKRTTVEFDAVSRYARVYINGHLLGERPYAYISFSYDLTPYLKTGENVLAVRVDTTLMPMSRWYTGSGIYGHIKLVSTNPVHVPQWGTYITTPQVDASRAEVVVRTSVVNESETTQHVRLQTTITDAQQQPPGFRAAQVEGKLSPGERREFTQTATIERPHLWSPDSPSLYRAISRVYLGAAQADEQETDVVDTRFGVRSVRWDADTGFWLNGENVKLKGMCMHWCAGGLGIAVPDSIVDEQLELLKKMGTNAIRTGHRPFPPRFYERCDQLGIMVMDEAFDGWHKKAEHDYGAHDFAKWWRRDLTDMVLRDRNHPCVVLWSIGNETGNRDKYGMTQILHELDPTRLVSGGQVLYGVDIAGFNGPGEVPGVLEKFHAANTTTPILLSEEPHTLQVRGFYRTRTFWRDNNPESRMTFPSYGPEEVFNYGGDPQFCSSYDNALVRITTRDCWRRTRDTPWISAQFAWVAFDYLGETHWNNRHWPARLWHPGILDAADLPKDIYYFYQSQWTTAPMVHLLPHWSHPLVPEGTTIPVVAYSNCDEVELTLNGKSLGRKPPRDILDFTWDVPCTPGELQAVGYRGGKPVAKYRVRTVDTEWHLSLEPGTSGADGVSAVTITARDGSNEPVPYCENRVDLKVTGPAQLLAHENGNPIDVNQHQLGWRNLFAGISRSFYRATSSTGTIELAGAAVLGYTPFQDTTTVTCALTRAPLRGSVGESKFEVRYTIDGSEPTRDSTVSTGSIVLSQPALVRMLVLRDGQPFLTSEGKFEKGMPPTFDDPRYEHTTGTTTVAATFPKGPLDKEASGVWVAGKRKLRLQEDGTVIRIADDEETPIGRWWYDYPDDTFEDRSATGAGQLQWHDSGEISTLKLNANRNTLTVKTGSKETVFHRE
jgi:beta-galactosidase